MSTSVCHMGGARYTIVPSRTHMATYFSPKVNHPSSICKSLVCQFLRLPELPGFLSFSQNNSGHFPPKPREGGSKSFYMAEDIKPLIINCSHS